MIESLYLSHPSSRLHDMGSGHPECPARVQAVEDALTQAGLLARMKVESAPAATDEQILFAHSAEMLDHLFDTAPTHGLEWLDPDTAMNPHSLTAARHAAGAVVRAVDWVCDGGSSAAHPKRVFCNVRPPGHHATRGRAMGFCLINSVAVGIYHALEHHHLKRVALVDFDVHHGNGSEDILSDDSRVLMVSTFQHPFYPGSGVLPMGRNMRNSPLPAGSDGAQMRRIVSREWLPALEQFEPELIVISAGFDAHRDDPLAQLQWTEDDYGWITTQLCGIADRFSDGRIVSSLEGGYNLAALGRSASAHVQALISPQLA
jgi:acetoin utilization deacetylase AcuC-like enzyme